MATFKVNDRVRVIRAWGHVQLEGREGVVVEKPPGAWPYAVCIPGVEHGTYGPEYFPPDVWGFDADELAPLTPPAADEWAQEKVKQVTRPIHEPIRTKEPA